MPNPQAYNLYCQHLYKLYWQLVYLQLLQLSASSAPQREIKSDIQKSSEHQQIDTYTNRGYTGHDKFAGAKFERRLATRRVNDKDVMNKMVDAFGTGAYLSKEIVTRARVFSLDCLVFDTNSYSYSQIKASNSKQKIFSAVDYLCLDKLPYMGGRLYDAALGRMLQADPFVQDPTNTQSFNRYTYVFNNPISNTDPSGYFSFRQALGIVVGAVVGFFTAGAGWSVFWVGFTSAFTASIIITGNLKNSIKAGLVAGVLAFAGNGFSNATPFTEAANAAGDATGATGDLATSTAQSAASSVATDAATRAALKHLIKDIVTQIVQSIDPELGAALSFVTNPGNFKSKIAGKKLGIGGFLRNLTSKYANLKATLELQRFAKRNGLTLQELNLFLITASFLGNKIVGTRFYERNYTDSETGQGVRGILSRKAGTGFIDVMKFRLINRTVGLIFDAIDITLGFQGLITASGYDAIKNADRSKPIGGISLGSLDSNNLVARGYFLSGVSKSLVFGNIGHSNIKVIIGAGDIVNGAILGIIFNPWAKLLFKNHGCALHELSGCY